MRQLSSFFVVVGDTPTHTICEVLSCRGADGAAGIWRFAIQWDCDHDERIVQVVNHLVVAHDLGDVGMTRIGERKGCLSIHAATGEPFSREYFVNGDMWNVEVSTNDDPITRAFDCGWRPFVDAVVGGK